VIVSLGWGSLIWCQKTLPVIGTWQLDGPGLPVEFARESRDKRITLVICDGALAVKTLWAALDVPTLDAAKQALAAREGVKRVNIEHCIGWWSPTAASEHSSAPTIGQWASERRLEGVVWTALKPKIGGDYRIPQRDEVIQHLSQLQGVERDIAEEYVRLAPRQIATRYRTGIEDALGWTASGLI